MGKKEKKKREDDLNALPLLSRQPKKSGRRRRRRRSGAFIMELDIKCDPSCERNPSEKESPRRDFHCLQLSAPLTHIYVYLLIYTCIYSPSHVALTAIAELFPMSRDPFLVLTRASDQPESYIYLYIYLHKLQNNNNDQPDKSHKCVPHHEYQGAGVWCPAKK